MKKFYLFFCLMLVGSVVQAQVTKFWVGAGTNTTNLAASGNWNTAASWSPSGVPGTLDSVVFNNTVNVTVTLDFATSTTFNAITTSTGANVTFTSGTNVVKTINLGGAGTSGQALNVRNTGTARVFTLLAGANNGGIIIKIPTNYTASISGTMTFSTFYSTPALAAAGITGQTAQLLGIDAGSIVFNNTASVNCNYNLGTSPFYLAAYNNTNNDIVRFTSGSKITYYGGGSLFGKAVPDATVKYESGSTFIVFGGSGSGGAQLSGRTYGNLQLANGGTGTATNTTNVTTTVLDTLIVSGANLNFSNASTGTASPTFAINHIRISGNASLTLASDSATTGSPRSASYTIGGIVSVINAASTSTNSSLVLGNSFGTTTNKDTITFTGSGKTISTSVLGTGTATISVGNAASGTYTTNLIIDSTANIALDADLNLTSANNNTTLLVRTKGVLSVSTGRTLTTNGKLTLQSTATGTASIGNSAGTISGNVIVQRYIPSGGRRGYVLVGAPLNSAASQTIYNGWQEGGASTAGLGTLITGGSAGGTNGFDNPTTSAKSIFTYNDALGSGSKWVGLTNTNATNLSAGAGYLLYVRGDRTLAATTTNNTNNSTVLRATGTIQQGSVSPTLLTGANNYTLIANPYPCAIDWNASNTNLTKTNLTGSFTVYDSNLGIFVSSDGTTKTPSSGVATGNQQARYIQSGQAFFVQNTAAGSGAITFTEAAKTTAATTSSATTVFGEGATARQQLNINAYRTVGNVFADGAVALFGANYKAAVVDNEDITKFTNFNETFGLRRNATVLGLEARPLVASTDTLYVNMSNFGKRDYSLVIDGSNFTNTNATLEDQYKATKTAIDLNGTTTYNFTVNDDVASVSNDRFKITFGSTAPAVVIADAPASLYIKMSPNPVVNQLRVSFKTATSEATSINIVNSLGQVVKTVNAGEVSSGNVNVPVAGLASGVYNVQLISGGKVVNTQKVVKAQN